MKRLLFLCLFLLPCGLSHASGKPDEQAIRAMLATQVVEWNRGNLAGYMIGYWESDSLVFIGKNGPTYGFDSTLARYRISYPDTAQMGKLTSTVLRVRVLSPEYAYVTGRWHLKRSARDLKGHYTLLLKRIRGQWVIIEDHSS